MAKFEKLEGSMVKLTIEISAEKFEEATEKAYRKTAGKYAVQGFRKGKAPRRMIENLYGPMVFFDDAFDIAFPEAYEDAIKEHNVEPVGRPDVSIEDIGPGKPVVLSAAVPVKPEVELGAYKGIEVEAHEYNVTDEMVDAAIESEREKLARMVESEGPVKNGDTVGLDYSGSVDGVKFDGGTAEGQQLVIGSNTFIPGFEEQMIGMAVGEEKDLTVTFPEEYHSKDLAGKEAVFAVKVNSIEVKELPELDDEFAKDVSEFDTLEELKNSKRAELQKTADSNTKAALENEVVSKAAENAKMDIPEAMIERELDYMLRDVAYRLSMQGMSMEDYYRFTGSSEESMRGEFKKEAESRIRTRLVLEAISKAENVEADAALVDEKISEYAKQFGDNAENFLNNITDDDRKYFADQIVTEKTVDLLRESAVVKKPKKTAAKKKTAKQDAEEKAE